MLGREEQAVGGSSAGVTGYTGSHSWERCSGSVDAREQQWGNSTPRGQRYNGSHGDPICGELPPG